MNKKKLITGVVLIAAGWFLYQWIGGTSGNKLPSNVVRISAAPATKQDIAQQLDLVGTVVAYESVALKSRIDSQVTNVLFKDGDYVTEGQILFELDDRAITAQMKELEANLAKDRANLVNTKLQYERSVTLAKSNTVAQSRVDETRAAYEAQKAQVASTEAALENSRVLLSYTRITAPISGRAGTINVTRGNNVRSGDAQPLVTINQVKPIRVQFAIPQRYYETIRNVISHEPLRVIASRSESEQKTQGELEYLDNAVDTSNGTFAARARFENEQEQLWPGMFVNVSLQLGTLNDVLTVPSVAIQGDEGKYYVYRINADNTAKQQPVEVIQIRGGIAAVSAGLNEGDKVAIDGMLRLSDDVKVEIAEAEKTAAPKE